jgi:hypothetical protein
MKIKITTKLNKYEKTLLGLAVIAVLTLVSCKQDTKE